MIISIFRVKWVYLLSDLKPRFAMWKCEPLSLQLIFWGRQKLQKMLRIINKLFIQSFHFSLIISIHSYRWTLLLQRIILIVFRNSILILTSIFSSHSMIFLASLFRMASRSDTPCWGAPLAYRRQDFECTKCACVGRFVKTCKTVLQTYPEATAVVVGESDYDQ